MWMSRATDILFLKARIKGENRQWRRRRPLCRPFFATDTEDFRERERERIAPLSVDVFLQIISLVPIRSVRVRVRVRVRVLPFISAACPMKS